MNPHLRLLLAGMLVLPLCALEGQENPKPAPQEAPPEDPRPDEQTMKKLFGDSTLLLPESKSAAEELAKAATYEKADHWLNAVRIYQNLIEKHGDRILPIGEKLFAGVRAHCEQILLSDPPQRLKTYREIFDPVARKAMESAVEENDMPRLGELARTFSLTTPGEDLLNLAGDLAFEDGRFEEAVTHWGKLIRLYPKSPRAISFLPKFALVIRRSPGNTRILNTLTAITSKNQHARETVTINEKKYVIEDYLKGVLSNLPASAPDDYRSYKDYFYPKPYELTLDARKWQRKPPRHPAPAALPRDIQPMFSWGWRWERDWVFPAVERDMTVVRHHDTLTALHLPTGQMMRKFDAGSGISSEWSHQWFENVTLHNDTAYTSMWQHQIKFETEHGVFGKPGLTYRKTWTKPTQNLFGYSLDTDGGSWFEGGPEWFMKTAPEATDENLFVVAQWREPPGPPGQDYKGPEYHVVCLDRATGKFRWTTLLGRKVAEEYTLLHLSSGGKIGFYDTPPQFLSRYGDTLFVSTNAGLVAALDMGTGTIQWARAYPAEIAFLHFKKQLLAPPLIDRGRLVVSPLDTSLVLCLDASTGELKWSYQRSKEGWCEGIVDGKVVIAEKEVEYKGSLGNMVITEKPRVVFLNVDDGKKAAEWIPPAGTDMNPVGKGALSNTTVYLPTAKGVWAIPVKDVNKAALIPWPDARDAGTILLLPQGTLTASPAGLTLFSSQKK